MIESLDRRWDGEARHFAQPSYERVLRGAGPIWRCDVGASEPSVLCSPLQERSHHYLSLPPARTKAVLW